VSGTSPLPLPDLPVVETLPALRAALTAPGRAIVVAPPGAGKTTLVPLALVDEPWLAGRRIVMLEPRRLATRAAARRMAHLLGERVGDTVGYQTRDERHIGPSTRIEVVTEGILTRRLQTDPELPGVGLVIFDEVHERNLPTDLGWRSRSTSPPRCGPTCGSSRCRPRPTPRRSDGCSAMPRWSRAPDGRTRSTSAGPPADRSGPHRRGHRSPPSSRRSARSPAACSCSCPASARSAGAGVAVEHGARRRRRVPARRRTRLEEQDRALAPSPPGRRRVVLATDIAETSLTVDGVRVVVDSGAARAPRFDVRTGMTRLTTITTSRASADQRAGRAGRTEPGVCYRLWSKVEHGTRRPTVPRDRRRRPRRPGARAGRVGHAGRRPRVHDASAEPRHARRRRAAPRPPRDRRRRAITDIGRRMLGLPVHPRLARMLVAEATPLACAVAAAVDERDVLRGPIDTIPADLALRVRLVAGHDRHDLADRRAVDRLRERAADLARRVGIRFDRDLIDADRTGAVLLHAFPDRLAMRRRPGQFQLRSGTGAWVPDTDPLAHEPFVVAADLDGKRDRSRIRLAAALDADDIAHVLSADIDETATLEWDQRRDDLVERTERRLGGMRLGEVVRPAGPGDATTAALLERARATGLAVLGWSAASISLRERVSFLHRTLGDPWPDWSIEALARTLDNWLAPYLPGATGRATSNGSTSRWCCGRSCPWPEGAELDDLAPPALALPTGRSVPIDYRDDRRRRRSASRTCSGPPCTRPPVGDRSCSTCSRRPTGRSRSRPTCPGSGRAAGPRSARTSPAATRSTSGRPTRRPPPPSD
jgi:ATP-dependent helicase HrpB